MISFIEELDQFGNVQTPLSDHKKDLILGALPTTPSIVKYHSIQRLGPGMHIPCMHDLISEFPNEFKFLKSHDGKRARYYCQSIIERRVIADNIRSLKDYGYNLTEITDDYVEFSSSEDTSIAPIMAKIGLVPLYTEHKQGKESIFYAVPYKKNSSTLLKELQKRQDKLSKKGKNVSFPNKITRIQSDMYLPNMQFYSTKFMELLINHKPKFTKPMVMTLTALYLMAEYHVVIRCLRNSDLIDLVHRWWGEKLSKKTIEKHIQGDARLQDEISGLYDSKKINSSIHSNPNHKPQFVSHIDDDNTSMKESMEENDDKK